MKLLKKKIAITVEQKHIDNGKIGSCSSCPIALAAVEPCEKSFGPCEVLVGFGEIEIRTENGTWKAELPSVAVNFVDTFDSDLPVEPFAFDISV